ncbi:MAG: cyclic nucleotide-binding protein [Pseudomonadota bacterium]
MTLFTVIGLIGVVGVLAAYGLLSSGRVKADEARYQWLNIAGTAGILISLGAQWNFASFVANAAWLLIGLVGLGRIYLKRRR